MVTEKKEVCEVSQTIDNKRWIKNLLWISLAVIIGTIVLNTFNGTNNWDYSKTFEVEVRNYDDQKVCGLPSGDGMRFKLPHNVYVALQNGTSRFINGDILIENSIEGEEFEVRKDGCVTLTLTRVLEFKESPNSTLRYPQRFRIQFYR